DTDGQSEADENSTGDGDPGDGDPGDGDPGDGDPGDGDGDGDPPDVDYAEGLEAKAICTNASGSCALKLDGTLACWGGLEVQVDDLATNYVALSEWCGFAVTTDGEIIHYLGSMAEFQFDSPPYVSVMGNGANTCAIRADGEFDCWLPNADDPGAEPVPDGPAVAFSSGFSTACLLRPSHEVACWTLFDDNTIPGCKVPPVSPPGQFRYLHVRCGEVVLIDEQGVVQHWSFTDETLAALTAFGQGNIKARPGVDGVYVLQADGALVLQSGPELVPVVPGNYSQFAANPGSGQGGHACAIRADNQRVVCWGKNDLGQAVPPLE
ncbi:MAG: hypothetical protein ACK4V6_17245, partial [Microthrixaceae bacterium]